MNIIGQQEALTKLFSADPAKARSFLIEGPRGVGKAMLALKFAAKLLDNENRVAAKSHPDLLVVEKRFDEKTGKTKAEIVIDDARGISSFLSLTPAEGNNRVVIVDSADELNTQSANAILKVVEEPPKRAIIILLSHGGHVLPTIRSRCTTIRAHKLKESEMERILMNLIPSASSEEMAELIRLSEGSPGVAQEIFENDGLVLYTDLQRLLKTKPDYQTLARFAEGAAGNWEIFKFIFSFLTNEVAKQAVSGEAKLPDLEAFMEKISDWNNKTIEAEIYNLDKKQLIISTLSNIAA